MVSKASSVAEYLQELPEDRRGEIEAVRAVVNGAVPEGIEEGMQYGMIGWFVPHSLYPAGYHCDKKQPLPFVHLASQKNHLSLYLFCVYADESARMRIVAASEAMGRKPDSSKGCLRFKRASDLPLEAIREVISSIGVDEFIARYEATIPPKKAS